MEGYSLIRIVRQSGWSMMTQLLTKCADDYFEIDLAN